MASFFMALELGLGLGSHLMPEVCNEINTSHQQNKAYVSTADACRACQDTAKQNQLQSFL
jgi:hypothetical protein